MATAATSAAAPAVRPLLGEATPRFGAAADVVCATALPADFSQWGSTFDVVVLLYPRTLGAFDPSKAEYVVLLNAGWLE